MKEITVYITATAKIEEHVPGPMELLAMLREDDRISDLIRGAQQCGADIGSIVNQVESLEISAVHLINVVSPTRAEALLCPEVQSMITQLQEAGFDTHNIDSWET